MDEDYSERTNPSRRLFINAECGLGKRLFIMASSYGTAHHFHKTPVLTDNDLSKMMNDRHPEVPRYFDFGKPEKHVNKIHESQLGAFDFVVISPGSFSHSPTKQIT